MNILRFVFLFFISTLLFYGCITLAPISYSEKVIDNKILGFWYNGEDSDNYAKGIYVHLKDSKPYISNVDYDIDQNKFIVSDSLIPIFFHQIIKDSLTYNFFSLEMNLDDSTVYFTCKFNIDKIHEVRAPDVFDDIRLEESYEDYLQRNKENIPLEMSIQPINSQFLSDWANETQISSSKHFAEFIEKYVEKTTLYDKNKHYRKLNSLEEFHNF